MTLIYQIIIVIIIGGYINIMTHTSEVQNAFNNNSLLTIIILLSICMLISFIFDYKKRKQIP